MTSSSPHRNVGAIALLLAAAIAFPSSAATHCDSEAWAFYGAVRDTSGRPVAEARVYLLLDKINEAAYAREGMRARRFWTNEYGKYQAGLICGDNSDSPNPCARKLKHLTVMVDSGDHAMTLKVFKLRDLEIVPEDGACFVRVPEIRLQRGR